MSHYGSYAAQASAILTLFDQLKKDSGMPVQLEAADLPIHPEGDVEIVLSAQDKCVLRTDDLAKSSEFFRLGLKEPWLQGKLTGETKTLESGRELQIKRYTVEYDKDFRMWALVGYGDVSNSSKPLGKILAGNETADPEELEKAQEAQKDQMFSKLVAARAYQIIFSLLLHPPSWSLCSSLETKDIEPVLLCADLCGLTGAVGPNLAKAISGSRVCMDDLPSVPCLYLTVAMKLQVENLYWTAMGHAAGRELIGAPHDSWHADLDKGLQDRITSQARNQRGQLRSTEERLENLIGEINPERFMAGGKRALWSPHRRAADIWKEYVLDPIRSDLPLRKTIQSYQDIKFGTSSFLPKPYGEMMSLLYERDLSQTKIREVANTLEIFESQGRQIVSKLLVNSSSRELKSPGEPITQCHYDAELGGCYLTLVRERDKLPVYPWEEIEDKLTPRPLDQHRPAPPSNS